MPLLTICQQIKKLRKAQISTNNSIRRIFWFLISYFRGKKSTKNIAIPQAIYNLPGLVRNLTSNARNKFERKISAKGAVRAEKGFTLFISNEGVNHIIKIIKTLKDSGVLIDGITETVKHEIKKKTRGRVSWSFVSTLSHFISAISKFFSSKRYKGDRS